MALHPEAQKLAQEELDLVVGGLLYAVAAIANELLKAVGVALIALT